MDGCQLHLWFCHSSIRVVDLFFIQFQKSMSSLSENVEVQAASGNETEDEETMSENNVEIVNENEVEAKSENEVETVNMWNMKRGGVCGSR